MKTIKIIFLCFGLAIMFSACGSQNAPVESKTLSNETQVSSNTPKTQKQEKIKIAIVPPAGWEPVVGSVIPVQYMKNTASFMVKKENFQEKTIDEVVNKAKKIFESSFGEVKYVGETENIKVSGIDARKIIFTCVVSRMQMKYEYVYLFADGDVYAITFGDLMNTFDSLSADYKKILEDISFK